jgi:hypothetical protein
VRTESGKALVRKKLDFEKALLKTISDFEHETGLSVTDIDLIRPEITGDVEPTLSKVRTTVQIITW